MDANREALFSSIGEAVVGAAVIDLFAGVGTLGLEALSRGAASAVFVESSPPAVTILRENVDRVGLGGDVVAGDVLDFLDGATARYDLAFVDPPYDLALASVEEVLEQLVDRLNPAAVVVVHRRVGEPAPRLPAALKPSWERDYGDAVIRRFSKVGSEDDR